MNEWLLEIRKELFILLQWAKELRQEQEISKKKADFFVQKVETIYKKISTKLSEVEK